LVKEHADEVKRRRLDWVTRTREAVKDRLTKEITYWDSRATALRLAQEAGKPGGRLNAEAALKRADELQVRLRTRLAQLALEEQVSSAPPTVIGGLVVVPIGLLRQMRGEAPEMAERPVDTQ